MKSIPFILAFFLISFSLSAQLENVIVEKYYISDSRDAGNIQYVTDEAGNTIDSVFLEFGSTTYRIYVQLAPGYMLTRVYGDATHMMKIESTENFFNNIDFGVSFGKDLTSSRLQYNSVALDSWLTIGQASRTYSGVLKSEDKDGSVIGGSLNSDGMLVNADPDAGTPLTTSDGLAPLAVAPSVWLQSGIIDNSGKDSTIFGSLKIGKQFVSHSAFIQCSGLSGVDPSSNKVLIAQLTTKGDLAFQLNIQVKKADGSSTINFVGTRATGDDESVNKYSNLLAYPHLPVCGCKDPNYVEYNANADCNIQDSCKTKIVCGCMDPDACNYDPDANYSIPSLCCYPGLCDDRDISMVCPKLGTNLKSSLLVYPNPVIDQLNLEVTSENIRNVKIEIYNAFGRLVWTKNIDVVNGSVTSDFNMSAYENGLYLARFYVGDKIETRTFIKK
jgi:hypothetical protein